MQDLLYIVKTVKLNTNEFSCIAEKHFYGEARRPMKKRFILLHVNIERDRDHFHFIRSKATVINCYRWPEQLKILQKKVWDDKIEQ